MPHNNLRSVLYVFLFLTLSSYGKDGSGLQCREIHIVDFGAIGDGKTNSTEAFQKAAAYLQQNGGTLIIDSGTYIVGKQKLSGRYGSGNSWKAVPILNIIGAKRPITIKGEHATLKTADGLKYGSFNPITGRIDEKRTIGNPSDYYASAYIFINAEDCASIKIEDLTMDGNLGNMVISQAFGDMGNQLPAIGIRLSRNRKAIIKNCYIHHCALDAIHISWNGLTGKDPIYPHVIDSVIAKYNGRQGLSWAGGNSLTVSNSEFSSTGKALNAGIPVVAKPAAGIDIEIQNSIIRNGSFINCLVYDNAGYGLSSIGHETYNINFKKVTFIGTTNEAAFPKSQYFSFDSCTFVGRVAGIYGDKDSAKANFFKDCLFTMNKGMSPDGKVFGNNSAFYSADNVIFDHCVFDASEGRLPLFNQKEIEFINCTFIQKSSENFRAIATFKGTTKFIMKGGGKIDDSQATFDGSIFLNGRKVNNLKNIELRK